MFKRSRKTKSCVGVTNITVTILQLNWAFLKSFWFGILFIDYDNYYMLTDEINEFLEIYLENVKGSDLDMESLTEEFNLFTVYIVFRKFWLENC